MRLSFSYLRVCAIVLSALLPFAGGCDKADKEPVVKPAADVPEPSSTKTYEFGLPAADRIVAIGDLHGDLDAARRALRLAGALGEGDAWIGGDVVVVQTGDQIDRGDDDRAVLDLLLELGAAAKKSGGALHVLNGNHETMNIAGDFRYVTQASFDSFSEVIGDHPWIERFAEAQRGRAAAFLPGGPYAIRLAQRPVVLKLGKSVFAHGGVLMEHVRYGLERINKEISAWASGKPESIPKAVRDPESIVWTRRYGSPEEAMVDCAELGRVLKALSAERLVVGHTVQKSGITPACGGRVWRIDVGLASYYGERPAQVLEIAGSRVGVLSESSAQPKRTETASSRPAALH